MKKVIMSLVSLSLFAGIAVGCTSDQDKTAKKSKESKESTEVTSGASANGYTDLSELEDQYDIVIIGAGGAGMTAALQAKEAGMNPAILEKMPVAGGNTIKSSSGMNASETKYQKEEGITDSNDKFFEETLKGGKGTNDKELLRFFVDHSADAIDWLDTKGIELSNLTITGGMSEKRTHRPADGSAIGGYLVDGLVRNVKEEKIPLFVNANVTEITEKDGQVNGVKVKLNDKETKEIKSNAVIVTTGGFGANKEMLEKYDPKLKDYVTTNQEGTTGDGIKMIEKLGGATVDMKEIQIHPTVQQDKSFLIGEVVRGEGAILASQEGTRFVNEMDTRDKVSAAITALPEKSAYLVFDQGVRERAKAIDFYDEQGFVVEGETIEELAKKIDMPEAKLKETIEQWNKEVQAKSDTQYNRATGMDHDLSTGPYYAIKIAPGIHHTMGGVKINTKTEVLKEDGAPIKGLYAAGEVTGGLHGANRIGGNAVADIIIFGRQSGTEAASFASAQK
ncbi:fumarate reductase flavoprotein subunit [Enterococcus sp. 7E2_DIV0204]|uniref:Fumarate reductase flavoprotein subunit n=1 Tax=Candidatus Enterococcus lemimoniae TaxID=1834167 RepID=A0ABZ2T3G0_9ENTE|nr:MULTISPECIES: flavocytochrome c [unclassified Enterococcus]OTN90006.1 fumarate reductase flavoprotein subunit [Enterococcus sp. 7E2_DIV0204]OTO68863.1 fumarate reductase flavoprotein subunit [Enterococcus sp. 12C11_DIV0727]OTP52463.1 fumarate reductase flavoprotein subunit [Enterococcus sp. 7D2_DIV0200]